MSLRTRQKCDTTLLCDDNLTANKARTMMDVDVKEKSEVAQHMVTAEEKVSQAQYILNLWCKSKTNATDGAVLEALNDIMHSKTKAEMDEAVIQIL